MDIYKIRLMKKGLGYRKFILYTRDFGFNLSTVTVIIIVI